MRADVLVIGAGVIGLTTAVALAEEGLGVRVRAERRPSETTSFGAGAIWGPYLVEHPHVERWAWQTFDLLRKFAEEEATGVRMTSGVEASRGDDTPPAWATKLPDYWMCGAAELPDGFRTGWHYTAPVVDMKAYLEYLEARLGEAGSKIEIDHVASLEDATTQAAVTVNCSGYGARRLVPDGEVTPIRGQLAVAENPGVDTFFAEYSEESHKLTYFLPHGKHIILGGTAEPGSDEMRCDESAIAGMVERCAVIEPRLRNVKLIGSRVGIRPSRPEVRVEHVELNGRHLIHNYGHGGAGVSLSWGCAHEVRDIVLSLGTASA